MPSKKIYLDNASTTALDPVVVKAMEPYLLGRRTKNALESAKKTIAESIGAKPDEITFTSGGTESNNFAIKSIAFSNRGKGNHLVTTRAEHSSILRSCEWLETQGFKVTYLDVDNEGFINLDQFERSLTKQTLLFSAIHGNSELGTIQNLEEIGRICQEKNVLFHTDACQSFTKTLLDVSKHKLNLITLSSHKIHGPGGVGALYIKSGTKLGTWQHGTSIENIPGIVGFAEAVKQGSDKYRKLMAKMRDRFIDGVLAIPQTTLIGPRGDRRLCNNASFVFNSVDPILIADHLYQKGILCSRGSSTLKFTLSRFTTEEEIDATIKALHSIIKKITP